MESGGLLEISGEDDSLLQDDGVLSSFTCSPLLRVSGFNSSHIESVKGIEDGTCKQSSSTCVDNRDNASKENVRGIKSEVPKLSVDRQQMKKKKKGGGFNLRKSLAWNRAFFTEEGVLDEAELSMLSGISSNSCGGKLASIDEEMESSCGGLDGASDSVDQQGLKSKAHHELIASTPSRGRDVAHILSPKPVSSARNKSNPASAAKRKVLTSHDMNINAAKRSGCSQPVNSSSQKKPANLSTAKAVTRALKTSKPFVQKASPSVSSVVSRSSGSNSRNTLIAHPAASSQKTIGLKGSSTSTSSSRNNIKSDPSDKLNVKSTTRQAKRNIVKPDSQDQASTNKKHLSDSQANTGSGEVAVPQLTTVVNPPCGNHGVAGGIKISLSQDAGYSNGNFQSGIPQSSKPSGLRMPSPSLGFFGQSKPASSRTMLQRKTQPQNLQDKVISNLSKPSNLNPLSQIPPRPSVKLSANTNVGPSIVPVCNSSLHKKAKRDLKLSKTQSIGVHAGACARITNEQHPQDSSVSQSQIHIEPSIVESIDNVENRAPRRSDSKPCFEEVASKQLQKDDNDETAGVHMEDMGMIGTSLEHHQIASQPSMAVGDGGKHAKIDNEVVEDGECSLFVKNQRVCSVLQLENTIDCIENKSASHKDLQSKVNGNSNQPYQQKAFLKPDDSVDPGYNVYREELCVKKCIVEDAGNVNLQIENQSCPSSGLATLYGSACSKITENKTYGNVKVNNSGTDLVVKDDLQSTNANEECSLSVKNQRVCSVLQLENTIDCIENKSASHKDLQSKLNGNSNQPYQQKAFLKPDNSVDPGYNAYREEICVKKCIVEDAGNVNLQIEDQSCPSSGLATLSGSACSKITENKTYGNVKVNNSGRDLVVKDDLQSTNANGLVEEDKMVISSSADDQQLITLDNAYQSVVLVSEHSSAFTALESSIFPFSVPHVKQDNGSESAREVEALHVQGLPTPIEGESVTGISGDGIEYHIEASPRNNSDVGATIKDCAVHSMESETELEERNIVKNSTVESDVHVQASKDNALADTFNNFGESEANAEFFMVVDTIDGQNEEDREAQTSSLLQDQVSLESEKLDVEGNSLQETVFFPDLMIASDNHIQTLKDSVFSDTFNVNFGDSVANAKSSMVVDSINGQNEEDREAQTSSLFLDEVSMESEKLVVEDDLLQETANFPDIMITSDVHVLTSKDSALANSSNLNFGDSEANAESSMVVDSINGQNEERSKAQTSGLALDQVPLESEKVDVGDNMLQERAILPESTAASGKQSDDHLNNFEASDACVRTHPGLEDDLLQETANFPDIMITSDVHILTSKDSALANSSNLNFGDSEANAESSMVVDSINGQNEERSKAQTSDLALDQVPLESEELDVEDNMLQERAILPDSTAANGKQSDDHLNSFEASDTCIQTHPGLEDIDLIVNKDNEQNSIDIPGTYISGDIDCCIDGQCRDNNKLSDQASLQLNAPSPKNEDQFPLEPDVCELNPMVASNKIRKFGECNEVLCGTSQLDVEVNVTESEISPKEDRIAQDSNNPNGEILLEAHEKQDHTEYMDLTISPEGQLNITKQGGQVIKPPPHAVPFSDEWLAAIEAAGEEILTMKGGAVQNSPPDKSLPDPGPWSPVKRKNNQGIGPFDCTKYSNNNPPTS